MPGVLAATPDHSAVVIDIPRSISSPPGLVLRSTPPFAQPFSLPEPKNHEPINPELEEQHAARLPSLLSALTSFKHLSSYCHPRITSPPPPPSTDAELDFHGNASLLSLPPDPQIIPAPDAISDLSDIYGHIITNTSSAWKTLTVSYPSPPKLFHLPPKSSFLLAPITAFIPPELELPRFDFLLLDPPWPNRSAARKGDYSTVDRREIIPLLKKMPIKAITKPEALIGVWITNRPALRTKLLEEVLPVWGCEKVPEAEWTWIKVTEKGETVWDMESKIRKPYEVLMLLRRSGGNVARPESRVKDLVIVSVPEKHSRKPTIKGLIEKYLPESYEAAEIFGRNLTEGWFTWGDEAIKWNWDGHWASDVKENEVS